MIDLGLEVVLLSQCPPAERRQASTLTSAPQQALKGPRSGAPIFGRKRNRVHVEAPSITRSESTLVDHAVPPNASAGT